MENNKNNKSAYLVNNILKKLEKCSNCGLCKDYCPLYKEEKLEKYSPRGIISILKSFVGKKYRLDKLEDITDLTKYCTTCTLCNSKCPSNVDFISAIWMFHIYLKEKEVDTYKNYEKKFWRFISLKRERISQFRLINKFFKWFQIDKILYNNNLWFRNITISSKILSQHSEEIFLKSKKDSKKIGFFVGNMVDFFYPNAGNSIIDILIYLDNYLFIPYRQLGSGYWHFLLNEIEIAAEIAKENIEAFSQTEQIIASDSLDAFMWIYGYPFLKDIELIDYNVLPKVTPFVEYYIDSKKTIKSCKSKVKVCYLFDNFELYFFDIYDKFTKFFDSCKNIDMTTYNIYEDINLNNIYEIILKNNERKQIHTLEKYLSNLENKGYDYIITSSMPLLYYNKYISGKQINNFLHFSEFILENQIN